MKTPYVTHVALLCTDAFSYKQIRIPDALHTAVAILIRLLCQHLFSTVFQFFSCWCVCRCLICVGFDRQASADTNFLELIQTLCTDQNLALRQRDAKTNGRTDGLSQIAIHTVTDECGRSLTKWKSSKQSFICMKAKCKRTFLFWICHSVRNVPITSTSARAGYVYKVITAKNSVIFIHFFIYFLFCVFANSLCSPRSLSWYSLSVCNEGCR